MPFNGSGVFGPIAAPDYPAVANTLIRAAAFNANMTDLFSGLTNCVTRDGQSPATANLPMGGFRHTGVADASASDQYAAFGQVVPKATGGTFGADVSVTAAGARIGSRNTSSASTTLTNDINGVEITSGAAGTTSRFLGALKFGSTDSDFTTLNPKFGAMVVGVATETFNGDTTGGMGLEFYTTPNTPGASGNLQLGMALTQSRELLVAGATADGVSKIVANGSIRGTVFRAASDGTTSVPAYTFIGDSGENSGMYLIADNAIGFATNAGLRVRIDNNSLDVTGDINVTGNVIDVDGNELGYKGIPLISTSSTLTTAIRGKGSIVGGDRTVPQNTFAAGDSYVLMNTSAGTTRTLIQGAGVTLRLSGTTSTGNRSLAPGAIASVIHTDANTAFVGGPGVS